jgi:hypothetical protein
MRKILLTCISATLLGLTYTPSLRAQSGAESFNDIVSIFKLTSEPPELFLSPLTYASQPSGGPFSGVSFSVDGTALSMSAKFSSSPNVTSLLYQWVLPSAESMTYDNDGTLTLTGTNEILVSPSAGWIKIGTNQVLTTANGASLLSGAFLPVVPGSLKVGTGNSVAGSNSAAFGLGTTASGNDQLVVGRYNTPTPTYNSPLDELFIIGGGTLSAPKDAFWVRADGTVTISNRLTVGTTPIDFPDSMRGANSISAGHTVFARAEASAAFGAFSHAMSSGAIAAGVNVRAGGPAVSLLNDGQIRGMAAFGNDTWAKNYGDFAFGAATEATGSTSMAGGDHSKASGWASVALGSYTLASGNGSVSLGGSNETKGTYSMAFGAGLRAYGHSQVALGHYNVESGTGASYLPEDDLLIVGNGTAAENDRRNAMTVKHNGNTWIRGGVTIDGGPDTAKVETTFKRDVRVRGVLRVLPAGDLSMGAFEHIPEGVEEF